MATNSHGHQLTWPPSPVRSPQPPQLLRALVSPTLPPAAPGARALPVGGQGQEAGDAAGLPGGAVGHRPLHQMAPQVSAWIWCVG